MSSSVKVSGAVTNAARIVLPPVLEWLDHGTARWEREVRDEAKMVACPHAVHRFVKDTRAGGDGESGSPMIAAAHEDVVNPPERPVPIRHQRIARCEGMAGIAGIRTLPGVPVADACAVQGLPARPEAHAGCAGIGIEITGQRHMLAAAANEFLHEARCGDGLSLALIFEIQLPV